MSTLADRPWFPPWVETNPKHLENILCHSDVAAYLRKACEEACGVTLENAGCIAGGAIANLLYDLVYPDQLPNPITDVDWFLWKREDKEKARCLILKKDDLDLADLSDKETTENEYRSITLPTYVCDEEYRNGQMNLLFVTVKNSEQMDEKGSEISHFCHTKAITKAFDLNCCMAALDLYTNRVYVHPHFIEFLRTRHILLNILSHPTKTLLRLRDKANKFNIPNIQLEIDIIAQFLLHFEPHKNPSRHDNLGFWLGQKSLEKYNFNPEDLRGAFVISSMKSSLWTFAPTGISYPAHLNIAEFIPYLLDLPDPCAVIRKILQQPPDCRDQWKSKLSDEASLSLDEDLALIA